VFAWKVREPADGIVVAPDERLPWPQTVALGVQHVIAMFGATVLGPLLMGFDPNVAVLMSGVGTLIFFVAVGGKVPSYVGSSFSFIGVVIAATGYAGQGLNPNISVALGGIVLCGVAYAVIGFVVMATGCLSSTQVPNFPGRESFRGKTYHTGRWPHEGVDFTGQRVGIIGTGSSAIQSIPIIAEQARHLFVFQRTPNFSAPAHNGPLDPELERRVKADYAEFRRQARESRVGFVIERSEASALAVSEEERRGEYEKRWRRGGLGFSATYVDLLTNKDANDTAAEFCREKIRAVVRDPKVAELLAPKDYPVGTKRMCVDTRYYETYNRDNVTLIDIRRAPIEAITPDGLRTTEATYTFDSLVFATGFDAMTGALLSVDIRGRGGRTLKEAWAEGPKTYLGLCVAGFPNLFAITGPGSPSVLSNMIVSIEQHVDWIADCVDRMRAEGQATIEATAAAQDAWVAHVNDVGNMTLYPRANSWYMGANIPGKPRIFMPYIGGVGAYRQICDGVAAKGYEGFTLTRG